MNIKCPRITQKFICSISGTDYLKSMLGKQIDSNSCPETSTPTVKDDQNEVSCPDDFEDSFGRKPKQKTPDPMQQLNHFLGYPVSQSADEILQWPQLKDIFLELNTPMPSSAASERLISAAAQIFLPRRSRINDLNFQNQLICKVNSSFA